MHHCVVCCQQEQLRRDQQDIQQQRETLYRKLEALKAQGISLSPTLTVYTTTPPALTPQDDQHAGKQNTLILVQLSSEVSIHMLCLPMFPLSFLS